MELPNDTAAAPAIPEEQPLRVGSVLHVMQVAGAEVLVAEMIRRLGGRIRPTIFCLDAVGPLGEQLQREGVEVLHLGRKPGRDLGLAGRLAREIKARKIQILHAHQYTPFFYAALANFWAGRPAKVILTEHGRHYPDTVSSKRRWFNKYVLDRLADDINACCHFSAKALAEVDGFAPKRIHVIENGIDLDRYETKVDKRALRQKLGWNPDRRYLITVARFHPVKDHATLVRAFAKIARQIPDVDWILAGTGPLQGELEEKIKAQELGDRVHFLGVRADVPDLLKAADVFAMTSLSEAASLTIMEAMASRLPVVVTAVGGNPELVREGQEGLLVPRQDPEATARAISGLFHDSIKAHRLGEAGHQRVKEKYLLDTTIGKYYQLYGGLIRR